MKKLSLLLCTLWLATTLVWAGRGWGDEIGLYTKMGLTMPRMQAKLGTISNYNMGGALEFGAHIYAWFSPYVAFGLEGGFGWTQRGAKIAVGSDVYTVRYNYLDIPFLCTFLLGRPLQQHPESALDFMLGVGVVPSVRLSASNKADVTRRGVQTSFSRIPLDVALRTEVGLRFRYLFGNLGIKAFCDIGAVNTFVADYKTPLGKTFTYKNATLGIALLLGVSLQSIP